MGHPKECGGRARRCSAADAGVTRYCTAVVGREAQRREIWSRRRFVGDIGVRRDGAKVFWRHRSGRRPGCSGRCHQPAPHTGGDSMFHVEQPATSTGYQPHRQLSPQIRGSRCSTWSSLRAAPTTSPPASVNARAWPMFHVEHGAGGYRHQRHEDHQQQFAEASCSTWNSLRAAPTTSPPASVNARAWPMFHVEHGAAGYRHQWHEAPSTTVCGGIMFHVEQPASGADNQPAGKRHRPCVANVPRGTWRSRLSPPAPRGTINNSLRRHHVPRGTACERRQQPARRQASTPVGSQCSTWNMARTELVTRCAGNRHGAQVKVPCSTWNRAGLWLAIKSAGGSSRLVTIT